MRASRGPVTTFVTALVATLVAGGVLLGAPTGAPAAAPSGGLVTSAPAGPGEGPDARIVSLQTRADGGVRVVSDVTLPAADAPALPSGDALVTLATATGEVLRRTAPEPATIRAELPRVPGDTRLTGERVTDPAPVLRVRVPVGADLRSVAVRVDGERHAAPYRLRAERAAPAPTRVELPGWTLGPSSNRLDVVVLGDGYTAAQQQDFVRDATAVADDVFGVTPFREYRPFVNVVGLFVPSAESGADQPPFTAGCTDTSVAPRCCPDSATGNPAQVVDTRYDSTFCSQGIQRLLVPADMAAVYSDADAGFPAWEQVLMIVNDTEYGGSGGAIATASMDAQGSGTQVMTHELGHSLLGLDDEYSSPAAYPPCSDRPGSGAGPCPANTTDVTTRADLKWRRWVDPATPIPTTGQPGPEVVGLFQGAHYSPDMWYRSCFACLMRELGTPMGPVGSEQLPLRLFGDVFDVGLVEPGSVSPSTAETVVVAPGETVTLSLDVLSTLPEPATKVQWYVAGQPVRTDTVASGTVSLEVTGADVAQQVGVSVESLPGVLHPSRARAVTYQDRLWTLAPTAEGRLPGEATGAAVGAGRKYVKLGPAISCDPGDLDVRLVQPRRAAAVTRITLLADGERVGRHRGRDLPLRLVLFPDPGTTSISAVVERRRAATLTVERTYEPCGT